MRFMVMHKVTPEMEKGLETDPEIMEGVGRLISEGAKEHAFLSGEGLHPTSERLQLVYAKGERTVRKGPFADARELLSSFGLLRVRTQDEAMAWCDRYAAVVGDVQLFLGPVVEPWEMGMMEKPANPPLRFLALYQATAASEQDAPRDPQQAAQLAALTEEMTRAGVLQGSAALKSTKHGARIRFEGKKHTIMDGPFTESKELIAGYALMELSSKAEAVEWAVRFGEVVRVTEVDVRLLSE
jgi:hypothetical protein